MFGIGVPRNHIYKNLMSQEIDEIYVFKKEHYPADYLVPTSLVIGSNGIH